MFLQALLGTGATLGLSSCAAAAAAGPALDTAAPLPARVPPGTTLSIALYTGMQDLRLKFAGLLDELPFHISTWVNIGAGPDVINAFRSHSLELGNNAGIPPIQAHYQGLDTRVVAIELTRKPTYIFATGPRSSIRTIADFRGRRLAFSRDRRRAWSCYVR